MKKIVILLITILLIFIISACGKAPMKDTQTETWELTSEEVERNSQEDFEKQAEDIKDEKEVEKIKEATAKEVTNQTGEEKNHEMWVLPEDED